jgi:hypothetical protein
MEQKYNSNLSIKASFDGFSGISFTEITLVPKTQIHFSIQKWKPVLISGIY